MNLHYIYHVQSSRLTAWELDQHGSVIAAAFGSLLCYIELRSSEALLAAKWCLGGAWMGK